MGMYSTLLETERLGNGMSSGRSRETNVMSYQLVGPLLAVGVTLNILAGACLGLSPRPRMNGVLVITRMGCKRKSEICIKEVVEAREFFKLNMKMKRTSNIVQVNGDGECKSKCLESCTCKAYAEIGISRTNILCAIWEDDLQSIWEYADDGGDVYVRIKRSDIGIFHFSIQFVYICFGRL